MDGLSPAWVIYLTVFCAVYLLPAIIAGGRGHHNAASISIINVFLGWSLIGWVVALAMAASAIKPQELPAGR